MQHDHGQVDVHKEYIQKELDTSVVVVKERMTITFTSRKNEVMEEQGFRIC